MMLYVVIALFLVPTIVFLLWQFFHGDLNEPMSDEWGVRWSLPRRK